MKGVVSGYQTTLLLDPEGSLWCAGLNSYGQLGLGNTSTAYKFVKNKSTKKHNIVAVSGAFYHSLILLEDGTVLFCGKQQLSDKYTTRFNVCRGLPAIEQIVSGHYHNFFLDKEMNVWARGCNGCFQLGFSDGTSRETPERVLSLPPISQIAAGVTFSLFLDVDGNVWQSGVLGMIQKVPKKIENIPAIKSISGGITFCHMVDEQGRVWAQGENTCGQLGLEPSNEFVVIPTIVEMDKPVIETAGAEIHALFLDQDGCVYSMGKGPSGQLGHGEQKYAIGPSKIPSLPKIISIFAAPQISMFVDEEGALWMCGGDMYGQLGTRRHLFPLLGDLTSQTYHNTTPFKSPMVVNTRRNAAALKSARTAQ